MFEIISIVLALIILSIAVVFAVKNRYKMSNCISCILLGVFFATFWCVLPTEWIKPGKEVFNAPLYTVLSSLLYSFKALGGRQDIAQIETIALSGVFKAVYIVMNYITFTLAPILTSSLILSFVGDTGEKMRLALRFSNKCYIFSEINENSLALAKGIAKKTSNKTFVFCNTKDASKDLITKAKELGGITLYKSCEDITISKRFKKYEFCLISAAEDDNIKSAESIIAKHSDTNKTKIIVNAFVESGTNVKFLENVLKTKPENNSNFELRCIDEIALFCNHLIYNHPLYNTKNNCNTISVAIIGCGRTGTRMLKTIFWAGQIDSYSLKIRVYDKNADKIKEEFYKQCPGLKNEETIKFVKADVDTLDFKEKLLAHENSLDATYIVVAMGDDQLNLSISDELYRMYRRELEFKDENMPDIFARVRSEKKTSNYFKNSDFLKERHINLFGTAESIFSEQTLFNTELENLTFAVHLAYWDALGYKKGSKKYKQVYKNFITSEYDRRSSMATALHIPAKLCMCEQIPKTNGNNLNSKNIKIFAKCLANDHELCNKLAKNEHIRWNAFMLSEGYEPTTTDEMFKFADITGSNRDDLSMLHPCITDWDSLDNIEKEFNARYNKDKKFKYYDENIVKSIPEIWKKVQKMKEDV